MPQNVLINEGRACLSPSATLPSCSCVRTLNPVRLRRLRLSCVPCSGGLHHLHAHRQPCHGCRRSRRSAPSHHGHLWAEFSRIRSRSLQVGLLEKRFLKNMVLDSVMAILLFWKIKLSPLPLCLHFDWHLIFASASWCCENALLSGLSATALLSSQDAGAVSHLMLWREHSTQPGVALELQTEQLCSACWDLATLSNFFPNFKFDQIMPAA